VQPESLHCTDPVLLVRSDVLAMKICGTLVLLFALLSPSYPQTNLTMQADSPLHFLSAHGRRAWAGGYANGGIEVWAGALQIASDVHAEFRRAGDVSPIAGNAIVSNIEVNPSCVSRTYTGPDFSVEEQISVPLNERAVLFRYTVRSPHPVQVVVRFDPSLNLMWPAALGGQEIRWTNNSGFLLTESGRQFAAVVLAPGATAHDEPLNTTNSKQSGELAIALDPQTPQVLFAEVNTDPRGRKQDLLAAERLLEQSAWQQQDKKHYQDVLASEIEIDTPDATLNRALAWAQIALDQDWFCNDVLGCGYVGGYGPSRRNRRPQYAWYFAGDGMIALHGALAVGDLEHAREEIRFIARYQDPQSGMIWHELTQSAPYLEWREKYPYMFVHADLTYPYISTVADYIRASNDRSFLQEIWPSVQKAFVYGRSLVSADGLPRVPEGKEGANEQNPLSDELGLSAAWVEACGDYAHLAELMGQTQSAHDATELANKARATFSQRYWDAERNFAIQGYQRNGERTLDRGVGGIAAVNLGLFTDAQSAHLFDQMASWRFQSDWGTRNVAMGELGFDPTGYAHGSVWAALTAGVAQAYWTGHRPDVAWQIWRTLIPWSSLDSLGHMHEVLAGDTYHPQLESVPEQTWSPATFLSTAVKGLFGLQIDAETNTLTLVPHLPAEWENASLRRVRIGNGTLSFTFQRNLDSLRVRVENSGDALHMIYRPDIPIGARAVTATIGGHKAPVRVQEHAEDHHAVLDLTLAHGDSEITIHYRDAIDVLMMQPKTTLGQSSSSMKLTSIAMHGNALRLGVDEEPGRDNEFQIQTHRRIQSSEHVRVQRVSSDGYRLTVESSATTDSDQYEHQEVTITFAR
jgi:glycogen debranching enzyme